MYRDLLLYGSGLDILCFVMFFLALSALIVYLFQHFTQWQRNRMAPRLSVGADVVSKRSDRFIPTDDAPPNGDYFVTFEMEGGDRMELNVSGSEYGVLVEGDTGSLTFQGTRYLGFERMLTGGDNEIF